MSYKVVPTNGIFLVVNTETHHVVGRHNMRSKAEKQRRHYRMMERKRKVRK